MRSPPVGDGRSRVQELKAQGKVYPCFCSDEELDAMRAAAEAANLPPVYSGKWARASAEAVEAEMAKGTPFCFRFRVPANKTVVVRDLVRGDVSFNTDTLGDFVVMRSNGLPVRPPRPLLVTCVPCATVVYGNML